MGADWLPEPGDALDERFELGERIGVGPTGAVFEATRSEDGASVVVKVFHPDLFSGQVRGPNTLRLQRARMMEGEQLVTLEEIEVREDLAFVVMPRIESQSIAEWLDARSGVVADDTVFEIVRGVGRALESIHQLGVHGDIKPSNVFIDGDDVVTVGDPWFLEGLAGIRDAAGLAPRADDWLAPEQREGVWQERPETDIYRLALFMGWLLAGRVVVGGTSLTEQKVACAAHIDAAFQTATRVEPGERFGQVRDFIAALEAPEEAVDAEEDSPDGDSSPDLVLDQGPAVDPFGETMGAGSHPIEGPDVTVERGAKVLTGERAIDLQRGEQAAEPQEQEGEGDDSLSPGPDASEEPDAPEAQDESKEQDEGDTPDEPDDPHGETMGAGIHPLERADLTVERGAKILTGEKAIDLQRGEQEADSQEQEGDEDDSLSPEPDAPEEPEAPHGQDESEEPDEADTPDKPEETRMLRADTGEVPAPSEVEPDPDSVEVGDEDEVVSVLTSEVIEVTPSDMPRLEEAVGAESLVDAVIEGMPELEAPPEDEDDPGDTTTPEVVTRSEEEGLTRPEVPGAVSDSALEDAGATVPSDPDPSNSMTRKHEAPEPRPSWRTNPIMVVGPLLLVVSLLVAIFVLQEVRDRRVVASASPGDGQASTASTVASGGSQGQAKGAIGMAADADSATSSADAGNSSSDVATRDLLTGDATNGGPSGSAASAPAGVKETSNLDSVSCPAEMIKIDSAKKTAQGKPAVFEVWCVDRYEYPGKGKTPLSNVDLARAAELCSERGARLCTRREWRVTCGASKYPYKGNFNSDVCNSAAPGPVARPVKYAGSKLRCRSERGAYDMVGNVAEWTADGHINGGSAMRDAESGTCYLTAPVEGGRPDVGFRCCADPSPSETVK